MYRAVIAVATIFCTLSIAAQTFMGTLPPTHFKDASLLKPPAGSKVAIVEFEDLECSACAHAFPIVRTAMDRYKVPRAHHDFLIPSHSWSKTAAIDARYLEDKVSPAAAENFRRDVFANQQLIAGEDDLQQFTRKWFQSHGEQLPFVIDPSGQCAAEVQADCTLGKRLGVFRTPTIVVVTAKEWIEVTDPAQLYAALDRVRSGVDSSSKPTHN
jgi:protein-disulfide isomerase